MFSLAQITFPNIDPVAIAIGPLAIRWYALAYVTGILLGYFYVRKLALRPGAWPLDRKQIDDMITYAIIGIILGGRLGYVLVYNHDYYLEHPLDALKIWQGGMAFHGGLVGVLLAFVLFCRQRGLPWLPVMDMVACATPIGLFFGRVANFINGELFGRPTAAPWGVVFPHGGELPRHPSQLYEAGLEGLLLFLILAFFAWRTDALRRTGLLGGMFLAGYGIARAFVEHFREPDAQIGFLIGSVTTGQLLCVPMVVAGVVLMVRSHKRPETQIAA